MRRFALVSIALLLGLLAGAPQVDAGGNGPELVLQTGYFGNVLDAVLSPDGRTVISIGDAGGNREARFWNLASGRELLGIERFGLLKSVAFTPDGAHFLLGCGVQAGLWSTASRQQVVRYPVEGVFGTDEEIGNASLSRSGRLALLPGGRGRKGAVAIADATTGRLLLLLRDEPFAIVATAASADDSRIATLGSLFDLDEAGEQRHRARVAIWDASSGTSVGAFELGPGTTNAGAGLDFHPDGRRLLVVTGDRATVVDAMTGDPLVTVPAPEGRHLGGGVFAPEGGKIVLNSFDYGSGDATVHDAETGRLVADLGPAAVSWFPPSNRPRFTSDGRFLAITDLVVRRARLRVLEWPSLRPVGGVAFQPCSVGYVDAIGFSGDGAALDISWHSYGVDRTKSVRRRLVLGLDPLQPTVSRVLPDPDAEPDRAALLAQIKARPVNPIVRSPDGTRLVGVIPAGYTFMGGDRLVFYNAVAGRVTCRRRVYDGSIDWICFSPDSSTVLASLHGKAVVLWDAASGREIRRFVDQRALAAERTDLPWPYNGLATFSPDGSEVYANEMGEDGQPRSVVFDTETGERKRVLESCLKPGLDRPLVISPDGRFMGVENSIYDPATGRLLRSLPDDFWIAAFSPDGRRLAAFVLRGWKLGVAVIDTHSGSPLATITLLDDAEWIAVTPDGHFEGTDMARRAVSWRIGGEVFPLELYDALYHRPAVVSDALMGRATAAEAAPARRPPALAGAVTAIDATSATVRFTATPASPDAPVKDVRVFLDGRDLSVVQGAVIEREEQAGGGAAFTTRVGFPAGRTKAVVAAIASDSTGLRSQPCVLSLLRAGAAAPADRRLVVLAVGVSNYGNPALNLNFARADAEALGATLKAQEGLAYRAVVATVLSDEAATAPAIRAALSQLIETCGPNDVAVIHFSGHGTRDPDGALYYVPFGADPGDVAGTFLRWDDVVSGLRRLRASSAFFLSDCCHAGAFGRDAARPSELASPLVREARVMVFSACRDTELSLEMGSLSHGAFTYALLEGLAGEADLIKDGRITVSELQTYVASRVKLLTDDQQHPHIPLMQDFDPDLVLGYVPKPGDGGKR